MPRALLLLLLSLLFALPLYADQPFRQHRYDAFRSLPPADSNCILFVGNSITDMYNWSEAFVHLPEGTRILNRGVSGALSDELLQHFDIIVNGQPRQLFLMIGTNDLGSGLSPQHVADNVARFLSRVRQRSPRTRLYLQSILPSVAGTRTLADEQAANALLHHVADTIGATFIDLYPSFTGILDTTSVSLDGLHLTAFGYHRWCQMLAPYLSDSCRVSYPAADPCFADLWGSNAMRASYVAAYPVNPADILFFGDEMVKCGEWAELLHRPRLLNRGTGWGYDGQSPTIDLTAAMLRAQKRAVVTPAGFPRRLVLYTGTGDVLRTPLDSIAAPLRRYRQLIDTALASGTNHLYLLSLMPTMRVEPAISAFNDSLRAMAFANPAVHYVDVHTPLNLADTANPAYFSGPYLMSDGYRLVSNSLDSALAIPYDRDFQTLAELQLTRTPSLNNHWLAISNSFALSPLPAIGHSIYACRHPEARYSAIQLSASWLLTAGATMAVKYAVRRPRPYKTYHGDLHCLQPVFDPSFPSGHTSFSFAAATSLSLLYPRWYVVVPAYLWAGAVGFSRLYVGAHYPSDVITGAVLGTACSVAVHLFLQHLRTETLSPVTDGSAASVPLAVTIPFTFAF